MSPETLPADPLEPGGIVSFGDRLRRGAVTAEAAVGAYLTRIEALDGPFGPGGRPLAGEGGEGGQIVQG